MRNIIKKAFQFFPSLIRWKKEAKRLSKVDYFDYENLLNGGYETPRFVNASIAYGNYKAIARLTGKKFNFVTNYVEHGISGSDELETVPALGYADRFCVKNVYTFSNRRKKVIAQYLQTKNMKKNIVPVGPYIMGADNFHTVEDLKRIKERYGKILLVYPSHSLDIIKSVYDIQALLDEVDRCAKSFDSVFVCLHWRDIMDESRRPQYTSRGYVIVNNGLGSDPYFLSRQKDLMTLADMLFTNGYGTHIGYAIALNTPVYYYKQEKKVVNVQSGEVLYTNANESPMVQSVTEAFSEFSFEITPRQLEIVKDIWGEWQ